MRVEKLGMGADHLLGSRRRMGFCELSQELRPPARERGVEFLRCAERLAVATRRRDDADLGFGGGEAAKERQRDSYVLLVTDCAAELSLFPPPRQSSSSIREGMPHAQSPGESARRSMGAGPRRRPRRHQYYDPTPASDPWGDYIATVQHVTPSSLSVGDIIWR